MKLCSLILALWALVCCTQLEAIIYPHTRTVPVIDLPDKPAYAVSLPGISYHEFKDKVHGCILGAALGDMLGAPVEFLSSKEAIRSAYPPFGITGTESLKKKDFTYDKQGNKVAPYTDDTAMALLVLDEITTLSNAHYKDPVTWSVHKVMSSLAARFVDDMENNPDGWAKAQRAPGTTCLRNVKEIATRFKQNKTAAYDFWRVGKQTEGGCGSVMRTHPFGLIFASDVEKGIRWATEHSQITHGAPMALASCAAITAGIASALKNDEPSLVALNMYYAALRYDKITAEMIHKALRYTSDPRISSDTVFKEFLGWTAHEAIAAATYAFLKHPNDPKKAILLGVNTPGDSDSIASIAGALVGARVGAKQMPYAWLKALENKDKLTQLADNVAALYKK